MSSSGIRAVRSVLPLVLLLGCGSKPVEIQDPGDPLPPSGNDAQARVDAWLVEQQADSATVGVIESRELADLFPSASFFTLTFPQWPVGVDPPQGLASANVLVVAAGGEVHAITSREGVDALFATRFPGGAPVDGATAERAARGYVYLAAALVQDGYYAFEIVEASGIEDEGNARALVTAGGNGELRVRLLFSDAFKSEVVADLQMGPRPRCHATKLLDADPIVRQIVRDDLLFMGGAARGYLLEQRALAAPALQDAIDEILAEIERRGR